MLMSISAGFVPQLFTDHGQEPASGPQTGHQMPPVTEMHCVHRSPLGTDCVFYST